MQHLLPTLLRFWYLPPSRWTLQTHVLAAALLLLCVTAGTWAAMRHASSQLQLFLTGLANAQAALHSLQNRGAEEGRPRFVQTLPGMEHTDDVMRDMGRYAQEAGVQVNTVAIDAQAETAEQIGRVHFTVAATSPYKSMKAWLSDLLGRYPSLAIESLALQAQANDASRQDVRLTLVWYVKN